MIILSIYNWVGNNNIIRCLVNFVYAGSERWYSCRNKRYIGQLDAGQGIAVDGPGVDTYFVAFHQRFFQRGVAEYDRFAKMIFTVNEFVPNP